MSKYDLPKGFGWFLAILGLATMLILLEPLFLIPLGIGIFIGWLVFVGGA